MAILRCKALYIQLTFPSVCPSICSNRMISIFPICSQTIHFIQIFLLYKMFCLYILQSLAYQIALGIQYYRLLFLYEAVCLLILHIVKARNTKCSPVFGNSTVFSSWMNVWQQEKPYSRSLILLALHLRTSLVLVSWIAILQPPTYPSGQVRVEVISILHYKNL